MGNILRISIVSLKFQIMAVLFIYYPIGLDGGSNSYTYAKLNSLLFIDPKGLEVEDDPDEDHWWLFWAHFGTAVHSELTRGIRKRPGYGADDTNNGIFGNFRPDVYHNGKRNVWELKPRTYSSGYKRGQAIAQLDKYTQTAYNNTSRLWSKGNSSSLLRVNTRTIFFRGKHYLVSYYPDSGYANGLIFYKIIAKW